MSGSARGAYGLRLDGVVPDPERWVEAAAEWPALEVVRAGRSAGDEAQEPGTVRGGEDSAQLWVVHGDRIELRRDPLAATFHTADPLSDDALAHPYLGLPAAIASGWLGRQVLHAGAFLLDGGAWAVTADKGGGKSSTLAHLLTLGLGVLTDDLLMLADGTAFAGPRAIDLREEAATEFGGEPLGFLGSRHRWRLRPGPVPPAAALTGLVTLAWGPDVALERLGARERLEHLGTHSFSGGDARVLLDLSALPAWRLTRPRGIAGLATALDRLLDALG
jgi:hypothetical protein